MKIKLILCITIIFLLCSCTNAASTPPYLGVFLRDGSNFTPLDQFTGPPDTTPEVSVDVSNPTFTAWLEGFDPQNFLLVSYTSSDRIKNQVAFNLRPIQEENMYDVLVSELPEPDVYCFVLVDPLSVVYRMPHWCFLFGILSPTFASATIIAEAPLAPTAAIPTLKPSATPFSVPISNNTFEYAWSIRVGKLNNIGVAKDGKVYGTGNYLYAVFSRDGELIQTNEIPEAGDCTYGAISGRKTDTRFAIDDEGVFYQNTSDGSCKIEPGNPPKITVIPQHIYTFADNFYFTEDSQIPDGYGELINYSAWGEDLPDGLPYARYASGNEQLFKNEAQKTVGYINKNGGFTSFPLPDNCRMNLRLRVFVTPWDDVYFKCDTFDQLGNNLGEVIGMVNVAGSVSEINNAPISWNEMHRLHFVTYFSNEGELYYLDTNARELVIYNQDFQKIKAFSISPEIDNYLGYSDIYGFHWHTMFIGCDRNLYTQSNDGVLTKFYLPGLESESSNIEQKLKIAILAPLSGPVPTFGVMTRDGALMAIEEWNAKGGVAGLTIVPIVEDSQCTPDPAMKAANKVIDQDGVKFIIGEVCSKASIPVSDIANAKGVVQISPTSTAFAVTIGANGNTKKYIFRACFIDPFQGEAGAKFAIGNLGAKTAIVMVDQANKDMKFLVRVFIRYFEAEGGSIVGVESYAATDTDFSNILSKVADTKPDVVYLPDYYYIANLVTKQAKEKGIMVPFLGGDGWDSSNLDLAAVSGGYFINHFSTADPNPKVINFIDTFSTKYGKEPDAFAALAYDATNLMLQAIAEAGTPDPNVVKEILANISFTGVTGFITFDDYHNPIKSVVVLGVDKNGVYFETRIDP